jgi:(p)ppGpp synthase/HD superfamily hydrolase
MATDVVQRQIDPIHPTIEDLRDAMARYLTDDSTEAVVLAYDFASQAHSGHRRASGDPFIEHPLAAAIRTRRSGLAGRAAA